MPITAPGPTHRSPAKATYGFAIEYPALFSALVNLTRNRRHFCNIYSLPGPLLLGAWRSLAMVRDKTPLAKGYYRYSSETAFGNISYTKNHVQASQAGFPTRR